MIKLGALLHIMLPEKTNSQDSNILKYADTGIQETLRKFYTFGGQKGRTVCKIAGGAKMFEIERNRRSGQYRRAEYHQSKSIFESGGLRITGEDTGSNYARTMLLDVSTGQVSIRTASRQEKYI